MISATWITAGLIFLATLLGFLSIALAWEVLGDWMRQKQVAKRVRTMIEAQDDPALLARQSDLLRSADELGEGSSAGLMGIPGYARLHLLLTQHLAQLAELHRVRNDLLDRQIQPLQMLRQPLCFVIVQDALPKRINGEDQMTSLAVHSSDFQILFKTRVGKNSAQMQFKIGFRRLMSLISPLDELTKGQIPRYDPFLIPNDKHHGGV